MNARSAAEAGKVEHRDRKEFVLTAKLSFWKFHLHEAISLKFETHWSQIFCYSQVHTGGPTVGVGHDRTVHSECVRRVLDLPVEELTCRSTCPKIMGQFIFLLREAPTDSEMTLPTYETCSISMTSASTILSKNCFPCSSSSSLSFVIASGLAP